jgi:phage terminase Nu1 subunit (DNA packaging protein)
MLVTTNFGKDGSTRGGARPGAGRKPRSDAVALDVRERLVVAKADKEEHLAKLAAIEVAEKEGSLVSAADAVKSATRAGMAIRDAVLSLPGRVAAQLASMDDEREIERYLTDQLRAELTRLAQKVSGRAA